MSQLPYLQSERHFRRYEPYIAEIVRAWPQLAILEPKPPISSVETLASRVRICIKALRDNFKSDESSWDFSNPSKFIQICDEIVTSTTAIPGRVVCGPEDLVRKQVPLGVQVQPEITQVIPKVQLMNCTDLELIKAVIVLHHHKLLCEPSIVQTTLAVDRLAESYDVAVEKNGDMFTIL